MKEKPIIMSADSIRAILDGRKTQFRRVLKPQPEEGSYDQWFTRRKGHLYTVKGLAEPKQDGSSLRPWGPDAFIERCSPYQPGDLLWVRETWNVDECDPACPGRCDADECPFNRVGGQRCYRYKAQYAEPDNLNWRSPIHMPREAARLFLRVKDVRVERVQDISTSDCEEEGLIADFDRFNGLMTPHHDWIVGEFSKLWDSLNAKRGYPWESNPFVWVISFEKEEAR
jgi:hypothetical protein